MGRLISGDWLTIERLRVYSWILIVLWSVAFAALILTADGNLDVFGRPLGTDFANTWSSGLQALAGEHLAVYDLDAQRAAQHAAFATAEISQFDWHYPWLYPPTFLLIATPLALLPYGGALFVWLALTLPMYVVAIRAIVAQRLAVLAALAFPAVAINIGHGQNAFLSAGLLGAGLVWLDRRPVLSGITFGLLSYKPQFGLLIPLVLIATARWKVFVCAAVTVVAMIGVSALAFGVEMWPAFFAHTSFTRAVVLESGAMAWEQKQSLFAAVRAVGGGVSLAYAFQAVLGVGVAAVTVWLWRLQVDFSLKAAGLVTATLLVTPYMVDYDFVILGLALAWLAGLGLQQGFLPGEKSALAVAWAVPLVARPFALLTHVPLGLIAMAVVFALIVRRALYERSASLHA
ncbi:glycosyltransferase family 87 protein [Magnetovibrio sp.]|uniref:glycosyltransferase family 87 protein n=1 Tax=Magnetovibrio sp. TaxID=2024836 RepID=UPI002F94B334